MEMLGRHLKGRMEALIISKTMPKATFKKRWKSGGAEATTKEAIALSNKFSGLLMDTSNAIPALSLDESSTDEARPAHKKRAKAKPKAATLTAELISARTEAQLRNQAWMCVHLQQHDQPRMCPQTRLNARMAAFTGSSSTAARKEPPATAARTAPNEEVYTQVCFAFDGIVVYHAIKPLEVAQDISSAVLHY